MGNNRTNMKNKLNQIIVTLIIVLSSLAAFGEILETEKITISNDFVVVSNATVGSMTIEQQIVWVQTDEILTNLVLTAGDPSPTPVNVLGTYIQIADSATLSAFSNGIYYVFGDNDNDYGINTILGDLGTAYWDKSGNNLPEGTYNGVTSGTGKVVAAYSIVTNTYNWVAGYNSTNLCWEIARDSVPIVSVYSDSNVFHQMAN